jgi:AraC-like DNA-binding protein
MPLNSLLEVKSNSFAPSDRFAYWADVVVKKFVPLECDSPDRAIFQGTLRHRQIGLVGISDIQASAMSARRTTATIALGPSEDVIAVMHKEGACHTGQNADAVKLIPGEGAMVTADKCYFFEFPSQFRQLVLKLPRHLLGEEHIAGHRRRSLALAPACVRLLERLALSSLDDPLELSVHEQVGIERAFADLLQSAIPATCDDAEGRYAEARVFIRRHLTDPALKPAIIASELKMARRSLTRLFARRGTTIERTIWNERLAAARRDMLDPRLSDQSITAIAFSWAFSDTAHFSRSFSRAYGLPPSKYRAVHTNTVGGGR